MELSYECLQWVSMAAMGGKQTFGRYAPTMVPHSIYRRALKLAAAVAVLCLVLLTAGAFVITGAMGASLAGQPLWLASAVLPFVAFGAFILGTVRERTSPWEATASYFVTVLILPLWILLTR